MERGKLHPTDRGAAQGGVITLTTILQTI
jgi:hypothetical protein